MQLDPAGRIETQSKDDSISSLDKHSCVQHATVYTLIQHLSHGVMCPARNMHRFESQWIK